MHGSCLLNVGNGSIMYYLMSMSRDVFIPFGCNLYSHKKEQEKEKENPSPTSNVRIQV